MEFNELKQSAEQIKMPDEMQHRIIRNCLLRAEHETEEIPMHNKVNLTIRKIMTAAAVIALCLCTCVAAANHFGDFRDITNRTGAVIGTTYEHATNEIAVRAEEEGGALTVTASFLLPEAFPYRELEFFRIGSYQIIDASGTVIADNEGADFVCVTEEQAAMSLSTDNMAKGNYTLLIHSFVGNKKADQPLEITGEWTCHFAI